MSVLACSKHFSVFLFKRNNELLYRIVGFEVEPHSIAYSSMVVKEGQEQCALVSGENPNVLELKKGSKCSSFVIKCLVCLGRPDSGVGSPTLSLSLSLSCYGLSCWVIAKMPFVPGLCNSKTSN